MKQKDLLQQMCDYALQGALRKGAQHARVAAISNTANELSVLNDSIETIQKAVDSSLMIHLFVDGRYGTCSTNKADPAGIDKLLDDAVASVRLLAPDPFRILVPGELRYEGDPLYSAHRGSVDTGVKKAFLSGCAASVWGKDPALISVTAGYSDYRRWLHLADTDGLNCTSEETWYSLSVECAVRGRGDARPSDWDYLGGIKPENIGIGKETPCTCAATALERALSKRNPGKIASGRYPVIVENRVAATLLAPLIEAMSGSSLQQQNSFLLDKLGKSIASPALTLIDNPHRKGSPGYRFFDNEGLRTAKRTVIESGRLNTFFLSTYYALKMQMPPTISSPSLLFLKGGKGSAATIAGSMKNGIFVTGFNGGNCNTATGDFSYGIEGFKVENGQITYPVNEMVMTGNMLDLWNRMLAAGDDALTTMSWQIPSLLFDNIEFAGL